MGDPYITPNLDWPEYPWVYMDRPWMADFGSLIRAHEVLEALGAEVLDGEMRQVTWA